MAPTQQAQPNPVIDALTTGFEYVGVAAGYFFMPFAMLWAQIEPPLSALWAIVSQWGWVKFVMAEPGWTFNFVFAHLLFWAVGVPTGWDYGYDDLNEDGDNAIPSGPSGSGVVIISMLLVMVATAAWGVKVFHYVMPEEEEVDEDGNPVASSS